jgi:hypothetical protein
MEFIHEKLGKLVIKELTQGDLEQFGMAMREQDPTTKIEGNGAVLRAALKTGLVLEPKLAAEAVDGMRPYAVEWYARRLDEAYAEATTIPND